MKNKNRWRPWLTLAALLGCGSTWAASVTPTTVDGDNFTSCSQISSSLIGASTGTAPTNGQVYDLGGGQTITFNYTPPGQNQYIGFTSTVPIDYIVVKGGNGYNIFHYEPGVLSDTGLYSPDAGSGEPAGVSHAAFCFLPKPTGEKTAAATWKRYTDWEIEKSVTPTSITMFDGDTHEVEYTVTATPTTRGSYRVSGTITVKDPFDFGWAVTNVNDTIQFNNSATQFSKVWDAGGGVDTMTCSVPAPNADKIILGCTYQFDLESTANPFLLTATGGSNAAAISTSKGGSTYMLTATANFTIPTDPAASFGDTFSVDDSVLGANPDHVFTLADYSAWTYNRTFACNADQGTKYNKATGTWTTGPGTTNTDEDSASVTVACKTVTVQKTAVTTYNRDYTWTPQKYVVVSAADADPADCLPDPIPSGTYAGSFLCNDASITLNPGDTYDTVYKLVADQSSSDSGFAVSGNINVTWPSGVTPHFNPATPSDTLTFTDATNGTQPVTPTCGAQGATSLSCTYSANLPRPNVPGYNQASIVRVKKCYAVDGTPTDCGTQTYNSNQAALVYGAPTAENNKCVSLTDLFNQTPGLNNGIGFDWIVNPNVCDDFSAFVTGDIDPTAVVKLLDIPVFLLASQTGEGKSCKFMVPNLLRLSGENGEDEATVEVTVTQLCDVRGCTYTQGYWKTHVNYAPKPQFSKKRDATWNLIDGAGVLNENAIFYLSGKTYIAVMWTAPAGNVYYNLAHQFIAAKLNVLDGASGAAIAAELAQAEALFLLYGPTHNYWKNNKTSVTTLAGKLAAYNEGTIGPGHCSQSPASLNAAK